MQRPETPIPALVYSLRVAFVLDPDDTIYIIHARSLTEREKRRFRRRTE